MNSSLSMQCCNARQAIFVYLVKRSASLFLLLCIGCSAQSSSNDEATQRLKRMIRADYALKPGVEITLGERQRSDFKGYYKLPVFFSLGTKSQRVELLVSKDGRRLFRVQPIDDVEEKISLAGRPVRGSKDAKVTIVVFDDFECPYCAENHARLFGEVLREYGDRVRIYYKDYPLFEIHPWAGRAAIDANCLAAQDSEAYWEFADYVHPHAREISGQGRPQPQQFALLDNLAVSLGERRKVNMGQLRSCIAAQNDGALRASIKEGDAVGVSATPTIFINGEKNEGVLTSQDFRAMLDRELRDAGQSPPAHGSTEAASGGPKP
ncbi:MAG: thioredoxin domain-containing protein [Acidobacteria bacterium]|nr:thioredoxin domain-containing protein [Acidobacteriota bacterium]